MIRFFSTSHPVNILLLFLLGFVVRIPFFISPIVASDNELSGELYAIINTLLFAPLRSYPILFPSIAYLIIFIQGLSLNGFINSQKLFPAPNLLFVLSYIIFTAFLPEWNTLSPQLMATIIITILIPKLIQLFQKNKVANDLFMLAFITGLGGLLYKPTVLLVIMVIAGLLIFRSFRLADWIIVLFGFFLPYYFGLSYLFITDKWVVAERLAPMISFGRPIFFRKSEDILMLILVVIPLSVGFYLARKNAVRMVVLPRKSWEFISFFLLISCLYFFVANVSAFNSLILMMIPLCFFITAFLYYPAVKFLPSLYVWLIICFLLVTHFI